MEAEHERAEAVLRGIPLPPGEGGEPVGGRIVVAIGERLTVDETGWALAQDWTGETLNYGPWLLDFALDDDDPLSVAHGSLKKELDAMTRLVPVDDAARVVELHVGGDVPSGTVRRVLQTASDFGWSAWFRVADADGVTSIPHTSPYPYGDTEFPPPPLVLHLRADRCWVARNVAEGVNLPKIGDKQDFLAVDELMSRDRNLFPAETLAILNTDDDVPYGQMIAAFQLMRAHGYRILLAGGPPSLTSDTPVAAPAGFDASDATAEWGSTPIVMGNLTRADLEPVVKRHMNQIRYCYQRELVKSPTLAGKITVKFVITKDGSVSSATTKASTMGSPAVESCLNARFLRFEFPKPKGGGLVIASYPFTFRAQ